MNPRKFFSKGSIVELCSGTESGLPFVCNAFMTLLIKGILLASASKFPVTLCHFVIMRNHFHILVHVADSENVSNFVGYFKQELAHYVNRLCGKKGRLWQEGFDSPTILDAEECMRRMVYIYANPARAGVADSIENYLGVNSFDALLSGGARWSGVQVRRNAVPKLPERPLTEEEDNALAQLLEDSEGARAVELEVQPWAWMGVFNESRDKSIESVKSEFLRRLQEREAELAAARSTAPLSKEQAKRQDVRAEYISRRKGRRSVAFSSCTALCKSFKEWFREQVRIAEVNFKRWRNGDVYALPPPGFFAPGRVVLASVPFCMIPL